MQCEIIGTPANIFVRFFAKILTQVNRINSHLCAYPLHYPAVKLTKLQFNNFTVQKCKLLTFMWGSNKTAKAVM